MKIIHLIFWLFAAISTAYGQSISLPKTGQVFCYDSAGNYLSCAGTGQDGEKQVGVSWPGSRFTNHSNGTVTDTLTGLMWTQDAYFPGQTRTWQQALDYVAGMNTGTNPNLGYTDWRMPNIAELLSLVDHSTVSPAVQIGHPFSNIKYNPSTYFSSDTALQSTTNAWVIDFVKGSIGYGLKASNRYLWPVRSTNPGSVVLPKTGQTTSYASGDDGDVEAGAVWPATRFLDNNNQTVSDTLTGLMWTKNSSFSSGTWQQALDYVSGMNAGTNPNLGYTDWRLPNINELRSLVNLGYISPALSSVHPFTSVSSSAYWSSTTYQYSPTTAWVSYIWGAFKTNTLKTASARIWPVRTIGFRNAVGSFYQTSGNGGQCVIYVRNETIIPYAACNGEAADCFAQAQSQGYHTGSVPRIGSIIVFDRAAGGLSVGHVAVITAINGSIITLQDSNWSGDENIQSHTVDVSTYNILGYIYYTPYP